MDSVSAPPDRPPLSPGPEAPPEPNSVLTEAAGDVEMPLPSDPQTFFLGGIFALGVFAALYEASSVILPIVLAFFCNPLSVYWCAFIYPERSERSLPSS
jgi:hypothetical protein